MVVAQLVEQSLPIPEVRGSRQKFTFNILFTVNWIVRTKIKKKEAGNAQFLLKKITYWIFLPQTGTNSFHSNWEFLNTSIQRVINQSRCRWLLDETQTIKIYASILLF